MKTKMICVFIIGLVLSTTIYAQTKGVLTGPFGLKFGSTKSTVASVMNGKGEISEDLPDVVTYTGVKIGTKSSDLFNCKYVNNKLFEVNAVFIPELESKTQEMFDDLVETINNKYGTGKSIRNFTGIYDDGDGYEMQAVKLGYAKIVTYWVGFSDEESIISVSLMSAGSNVAIRLQYQDGTLVNEAVEKQNKKDLNDF